jgi:hypothetical protein
MVRIHSFIVVLMAGIVSFPVVVQSLSRQCSPNNLPNNNQISRRQAMFAGVASAMWTTTTITTMSYLVTMTTSPVAANAATATTTSPPTPDELKRIQIGYQQITDFLNNFEEATTTCRENGGECKRDAEPIRE